MTDRAAYRKGYVAADFLTQGYRVSGEVRTAVNPLADILNDSLKSYVEAENVYISSIEHPADITGHYAFAQLRKDNLLMAVLRRVEDGLPRRQTYGNPAQGETLPVFLTLAGFEVRGQLSVEAANNLDRLLVLAPERFIPLAHATAAISSAPGMQFKGGIILVNRRYISILCGAGM
ncbi:MAG: hypothetical protein JXB47_07835 [Anaerolineae bacterium]|nr:hypothetical protein [Anaerolineae bacterium]